MPDSKQETKSENLQILVIANIEPTFVKDDVDILDEIGHVTFWNTNKKGLAAPQLIKLIAEADLVYCWFASFHALLPVVISQMAETKLVLVSGGYDTASVPEIEYGNARHRFKKIISKYVLGKADAVIVNSEFAAMDVIRFMPSLESKLSVIPHRINPLYEKDQAERSTRLLLTVATLNPMNYRRKKIDLIKKIAHQLDDFEVLHIGKTEPDLVPVFNKDLPTNMRTLGFLPDEELWRWYHRAAGLLVPSWHEGFGVTAAEALSAGCLAFISGAGAQKEVTKGHAVIVESDDAAVWANAIKENLPASESKQEAMKKTMLDSYTANKRKNSIESVLLRILG